MGSETQRLVDALIGQLGEPHVTAVVDWGIALLHGQVSIRSRIAELIDMMEDIDGVIAIEEDLGWEVDDLLPPITPIV